MAPIVRKTVAKAAPQLTLVDFGNVENYQAGGNFIPEGKYSLNFLVKMHQAQKKDGTPAGPLRLGVMVTAHSLTDPAAEPKEQFYSMGSSADKSYAPHPETGKSLVPVPGGPGSPLNNQTNWFIFLNSINDCDPRVKELFRNDISVLDDIKVYLHNIPEPEERKSFRSATSEAAGEPQNNQPRNIAVVSEVLALPGEEYDDSAAPAPTAPAKTAAPKAAAKPAAKVPAPAPVEEEAAGEATDDEVLEAAVSGMTAVLTAAPDGVAALKLRTGTFAAVKKSHSDEMANAVINTFFGSVEGVNQVLDQIGYVSDGKQITPAA